MQAVGEGRLEGRMSVAALEEVWHLELRGRPAGLAGTAQAAYTLFMPLLSVTDEILHDALELDAPALGANDRVHAATCRANGIDVIVSSDREFDTVGWLRRIDPLDRDAIEELLETEAPEDEPA
jgi:predicted nucleic acid-binding protein